MKIILSKVDENKKTADFMAAGVRLNRFTDLFIPSAHPKSPDKLRYSAVFHVNKESDGVIELFDIVRKFLAAENKIALNDSKLSFLMEEKTFIADGDLAKVNSKTGEPYKENAGTWIIKPYAQERDKNGIIRQRPEVFVKNAYKEGMTIPPGYSIVGGVKKSLKKPLAQGEVQGGDIVNIQCQIYCALGRVCCSYVAVQLISKGERYGGTDFDAFADLEDSEELPDVDFSNWDDSAF